MVVTDEWQKPYLHCPTHVTKGQSSNRTTMDATLTFLTIPWGVSRCCGKFGQRGGCFKRLSSSKAASSKVLHSPTWNSRQKSMKICPESNPKDKDVRLMACSSNCVEKCGKVGYKTTELNLSPQIPGFLRWLWVAKTRQLKVSTQKERSSSPALLAGTVAPRKPLWRIKGPSWTCG